MARSDHRGRFCSIVCRRRGQSVQKVCARCHTPFRVCNARRDTARYCSVDCANYGQRTAARRLIKCAECGTGFVALQDHGSWPKFCSKACFYRDAPDPKLKACPSCASMFMAVRTSHGTPDGLRIYCSKKCSSDGLRTGKTKVCTNCGTEFYLSQSVFKMRPDESCCSRKCAQAHYTGRVTSPESRRKLSDVLKAKWASGTRKKNPPTAYEKSSETMKRLHAEGRFPAVAEWAWKKGLAARKYENIVAACQRTARMKLGKPNPPGPSAKGPDHCKALYWKLRSPQRQVIEGWNLNELVRVNAHLFDPKDVEWRKHRCRAARGLSALYETKSDGTFRSHEWKGWIALDRLPWCGPERKKKMARMRVKR